MKITKKTLKRIIAEEFKKSLHEADPTQWEGGRGPIAAKYATEWEKEEEEHEEEEWSEPRFSESEKEVQDLLLQLADAVDRMGRSNPELTDDYIVLFRALKRAGLNLTNVATLA